MSAPPYATPNRPDVPPRILILLNTCLAPSAEKAAYAKNRRNSAAKAERRAAQRTTWLSQLPAGCSYLYIAGMRPGHTTTQQNAQNFLSAEPDVLLAPYPDDLAHLSKRSAYALRYALDHYTFDYLIRSDDDDYIHLPRLLQLLQRSPADAALGSANPSRLNTLRGCCMCLPRPLVSTLAADPLYPSHTPYDDTDLSEAILRAGWRILTPPELDARERKDPRYTPITIDNNRISQFWLAPADMRRLHSALFPSQKS